MPERTEENNTERIDPSTARRIGQILIRWGKDNYQDFPWRRSQQGWHALLAEVLLQRTRAKNVVPVFLEFISKYPTPSDLANTQLYEIEELIYPLGLKWRAPLIHNLGKELANRNGKLSNSLDELLTLPAIGQYAASAWLSFHGQKRGVIIDANVVRLIGRLLDKPINGETRRKKWLKKTADVLTPQKNWKEYNYAILDFTMKICVKIPLCSDCPIGSLYCLFGRKILSMEVERVDDK